MRIRTYLLAAVMFFFAGGFLFNSCELEDEPTPTNELMEGVWELTSIVDESGNEIGDSIMGWFPCYMSFDAQNSVISTSGPVFMYLVYGRSRFVDITSKIDDVFKYADFALDGDLNFLTNGEWFIDKNKVVTDFTIQMKLRFPTATTLSDVFSLMNLPLPEIVEDALDIIVYHRFKYVSVEIDENNPDEMIWSFTDNVVADYNTKDMYGDYVTYTGIPADSYQRCTMKFEKRIKGLTELTNQAIDDGYGAAVN